MLVRMYIGAAAMENSMGSPQKIKKQHYHMIQVPDSICLL